MRVFEHGRVAVAGGAAFAGVAAIAMLGGCQTPGAAPSVARSTDPAPHVLTADIQAGIEKHIADSTARSGGYFPLIYERKEMRLKLVRVHTEYLANLGPRRHFAC